MTTAATSPKQAPDSILWRDMIFTIGKQIDIIVFTDDLEKLIVPKPTSLPTSLTGTITEIITTPDWYWVTVVSHRLAGSESIKMLHLPRLEVVEL